jgi:hypothetical protein
MSRGEALRLMAGTAAAGGLLVGCGSGANSSSSSASHVVIGTREDPVKQPLYDDNTMIESGLEPEKGLLRLMTEPGNCMGMRGTLPAEGNVGHAQPDGRDGRLSYEAFTRQ